MLSTHKYMDFVTAANEPMEAATPSAPQTVTTRYIWTSMFHIQCGTIEKINHTTIGALCSYIVVQIVQESYKRPQTNNISYVWTDFSIVLTWIQGPPNNWKKFVGNRVVFFKKKKHQFHGDMYHLNPNLLISNQRELNLQLCQHPHYGGRDHNDFHRRHQAGLQQKSTHHRQPWYQKCEHCMS